MMGPSQRVKKNHATCTAAGHCAADLQVGASRAAVVRSAGSETTIELPLPFPNHTLLPPAALQKIANHITRFADYRARQN